MQPANDVTVLGDFSGVSFTYFGRTSSFYKENEKFLVQTEGRDGAPHEYEIAYTFGVSPLQQYLIEFPGGRLQALGIAWDSRPPEQGGQRWFHLYPDQNIAHGNPLHWTRPGQTWNYQCAYCHSTNLQKNYDLESNTYTTTWSEIDVSCEACHGPGSVHVEWARRGAPDDETEEGNNGLLAQLRDPTGGMWVFDEEATTARRTTSRPTRQQIETCAPCHSRREEITRHHLPGDPLLNGFRPALLDERLYHPDGQILDEVYVYGSFIQSTMYAHGVTCSDCHDPHSLRVYDSSNVLCARCHVPTTYDTPDHHFHQRESSGSRCVECHMPATDYMIVDPRRDHSLRVPRPDLSAALGTPNACTQCHTERSAEWAARNVARWHGADRRSEPHFGETIERGRRRVPTAEAALASLARDSTKAGIVRASALALLGGYANNMAFQAIADLATDADPLVRMSSARASETMEPSERYGVAYPMLNDSTLAVRTEAARAVASVPPTVMPGRQRNAIDSALAGYIWSQLANADRPEAHMNIGTLLFARGGFDDAEAAFRNAIRLDSVFVPAYVNLADLRRQQGRDAEGDALLRTALKIAPDNATVHHALALYLVRAQQPSDALDALRRAAELSPDNARFAYVYGIALNSAGRPNEALTVLEQASARQPYDVDLLTALVMLNRDQGNIAAAIPYANRLVEILPDDQQARTLLEALRAVQR
jgi:tetratricopeptide (TPR) repeat protein